MKVFATYNRDEEIRRQSSSGGVFSILAGETLRDGGVVYGAAFDDEWNVVHRRVDRIDGLAALRGSKYVYSKLGTSIRDALTDLNAGRKVLFSGTPCQAAAMRKMAGEHPNLTIVEVVCHGAPEPSYWSRYLSELCAKRGKTLSDIRSIVFRDKNTGWKQYNITIEFYDGSILSEFHGENLYFRGFLHNLTLRQACFGCKFKYPNGSKADITLGDLWGISKIAPEIDDDKGVSLVIARSEIGENSVKDLENFIPVEFDSICRYNHAVTTPPKRNSKQGKFEKLCARKGLCRAIDSCTKEPLKVRLYSNILKLLTFVRK